MDLFHQRNAVLSLDRQMYGKDKTTPTFPTQLQQCFLKCSAQLCHLIGILPCQCDHALVHHLEHIEEHIDHRHLIFGGIVENRRIVLVGQPICLI